MLVFTYLFWRRFRMLERALAPDMACNVWNPWMEVTVGEVSATKKVPHNDAIHSAWARGVFRA